MVVLPDNVIHDPDAAKDVSSENMHAAEIRMIIRRIKNITTGEYLKKQKKQVMVCDFCVKVFLYVVFDHFYASYCPVSERTDIITIYEYLPFGVTFFLVANIDNEAINEIIFVF